MYGFSDQPNIIPLTRFSATLQGSSRYSTRILESIERTFVMTELPAGIRRLTLPLPLGIDHVHCYLLPGDDGWTLVDTGLGLPDPEARWAPVLEDVEVARILVTHFHPDHVGGGEDAQQLSGAAVFQGAEDYAQCERVWGTADWSERLADYLERHGL